MKLSSSREHFRECLNNLGFAKPVQPVLDIRAANWCQNRDEKPKKTLLVSA
jgi:hypothetical protein